MQIQILYDYPRACRKMWPITDIGILLELNKVNVLHLNLFNFVGNGQVKNNCLQKCLSCAYHFLLSFYCQFPTKLNKFQCRTLTLFNSNKIEISVNGTLIVMHSKTLENHRDLILYPVDCNWTYSELVNCKSLNFKL